MMTKIPREKMNAIYAKAGKRLFMFDYDVGISSTEKREQHG